MELFGILDRKNFTRELYILTWSKNYWRILNFYSRDWNFNSDLN